MSPLDCFAPLRLSELSPEICFPFKHTHSFTVLSLSLYQRKILNLFRSDSTREGTEYCFVVRFLVKCFSRMNIKKSEVGRS